MLFRKFGLEQMHRRVKVDDLLERVRRIDSISAQILLREAYETSYHILNYQRDDEHPWDMVLERHKENVSLYGTLYRTIYSFRLMKVHSRFGLNLEEFLDLPREFVELIFDICKKEEAEGWSTMNQLNSELEKVDK